MSQKTERVDRRAVRFTTQLLSLGLAILGLAACDPRPPESASSASASSDGSPDLLQDAETASLRFTDVTDAWGVDFRHDNGATSDRLLPETMGSGVAIFDADGNGLPDLFLVDSMAVADVGRKTGSAGRLYLNRTEGGEPRFEDATAGSGLDGAGLGMGAAVGDVDNDGDLDLVVTQVGGERLFLNHGDGRFEDVSFAWGLPEAGVSGFATSAAFVDVDRDGWLDLAVGRYVEWSPTTDMPCRPDGEHRAYCTPEAYRGAASRLYRNREGRSFVDATVAAGLSELRGKTLGLLATDLDGDLWPDLVAANDTVRNFLFRNRADGSFEEIGLEAGIAVGASGSPRGAMGIAAGDLDGDGRQDLVIGNFAQEMASVYRQLRGSLFFDEAAGLGVGLPTLMDVAFGTLTVDLDNDGRLDLVFANGHIEPDIGRLQSAQLYAQPLAILHNRGEEGFVRVTVEGDGVLGQRLVGRGLAAGDLDGDGDLDLVVTQNGRRAVVLRNDSTDDAADGNSLRLRFQGTSSNRTSYGVRVEAVVGDTVHRRWLTSGGSYLSASEPILTLGLGSSDRADTVRLTWPSGTVQDLGAMRSGVVHEVVER